MKKIIRWIRSFFIKPKLKFPFNITIGYLREILEESIDLYCGVHLGKPKKYYVILCRDEPYKFAFLVVDKYKIALVKYTIAELLDNLNNAPARCFDRITGKLQSVEIKQIYGTKIN